MTTVVRMEIGLMTIVALTLTQLAFRPITQAMLTTPVTFFAVPSATASVRPAFSANLVFTSADTFEMAPANDDIKALGTGVYTISGSIAHISLRLANLTPNAVYGVQCHDTPCSLKKPTVTADWKGRASFSIDRALLEDSTAEAATVITVDLNNKDGGMPEAQLSYIFPVPVTESP